MGSGVWTTGVVCYKLVHEINRQLTRECRMFGTLADSSLNDQQLRDFFTSWSGLTQPIALEANLAVFFRALKPLLSEKSTTQQPEKPILGTDLKIDALQNFFHALPDLMSAAQQAGFLCDPWAVASLKRDEVRNSAVLAWWLNPKGSHGFGPAMLENLLQGLRSALPDSDLPEGVSQRCFVRVESCPDGDGANRVDIEIDDLSFFLIIEVKIGAAEGQNQLRRYCEIAEAKAKTGTRPWAVVFLTPNGRQRRQAPADAFVNQEKILPMSWRAMGAHLDTVVRKTMTSTRPTSTPERHVTALLARRFSQHIRNF